MEGRRAGGLEGWSWGLGALEGWRLGGLEGWRGAGGLEGWYRTAPHRQQHYLAILHRIQSQTTANRSNRGITTMNDVVNSGMTPGMISE